MKATTQHRQAPSLSYPVDIQAAYWERVSLAHPPIEPELHPPLWPTDEQIVRLGMHYDACSVKWWIRV
ncbi:hypothetical protein HRE53_22495 [Acaryochloris sp. 'Moss Beach']|uniref:hypothetical protein n=1 Tax=Acaryochloris sp. 'Moss Beach' TaxID=2740837 RepID=UPI001F2BB02C|nr:hypothetical protein [Acaryochloris sp. 'Moss Beach']UJB69136.1 hypothetical protein HRE53_22495 [Acaryochloris sp. 'Moss Beach']